MQGTIPYKIAIPILILAFFAPMVVLGGFSAPLQWLNGVYDALLAIK